MKAALIISLVLIAPEGPGGQLSGPASPEIVEALELRARLGVEDRLGSYTIFVLSIAAHHLVEEYTRVATRDSGGGWTIVSAGEVRPALVGTSTEVIPFEQRRLTSDQARRLDRLLQRPALFAQVSPARPQVAIGAPVHTMEVISPEGRKVFRWTGRLRGVGGQVADIIMGRN